MTTIVQTGSQYIKYDPVSSAISSTPRSLTAHDVFVRTMLAMTTMKMRRWLTETTTTKTMQNWMSE